MAKKSLNIIDSSALAELLKKSKEMRQRSAPTYESWIKILRSYLRMTQMELSTRAKISQPHLVAIENGKGDVQIGTLRQIFHAMSCDLVLCPQPLKPLEEILRGRARRVALKRLKQTMGTMALEKQAPDADMFRQLLEKRTDDILADKRGQLWERDDA